MKKTHLDDYVERYGDAEGIAARVPPNSARAAAHCTGQRVAAVVE